jgi:hypothetical protein
VTRTPTIVGAPGSLGEAFETLRRATGAWPATNILQGYGFLFPSLLILLREIEHLYSDLTMILPTKFDLFQQLLGVHTHVLCWVRPCPGGTARNLFDRMRR